MKQLTLNVTERQHLLLIDLVAKHLHSENGISPPESIPMVLNLLKQVGEVE